mmetsp:Transcript_30697/g.69240  ORF Transcript_30697/g.69240 Transcript_30697/m.69240 type:complete len:127 (-) Transcript_30697:613-993(-)
MPRTRLQDAVTVGCKRLAAHSSRKAVLLRPASPFYQAHRIRISPELTHVAKLIIIATAIHRFRIFPHLAQPPPHAPADTRARGGGGSTTGGSSRRGAFQKRRGIKAGSSNDPIVPFLMPGASPARI